jgi:hypothetical protein
MYITSEWCLHLSYLTSADITLMKVHKKLLVLHVVLFKDSYFHNVCSQTCIGVKCIALYPDFLATISRLIQPENGPRFFDSTV